MRPQPVAEKNHAFAVTPDINPRMPWRVVGVEALPGHRLRVRFVDGVEGVVDMESLIASREAGVFSALADVSVFDRVFLQHGAVIWPGDPWSRSWGRKTEVRRFV